MPATIAPLPSAPCSRRSKSWVGSGEVERPLRQPFRLPPPPEGEDLENPGENPGTRKSGAENPGTGKSGDRKSGDRTENPGRNPGTGQKSGDREIRGQYTYFVTSSGDRIRIRGLTRPAASSPSCYAPAHTLPQATARPSSPSAISCGGQSDHNHGAGRCRSRDRRGAGLRGRRSP